LKTPTAVVEILYQDPQTSKQNCERWEGRAMARGNRVDRGRREQSVRSQENRIDSKKILLHFAIMLWAGFTYIMTSRKNTVIYTGATNNLYSRIYEHRYKANPGFSARYNTEKLVYYECFYEVELAFEREAQIKSWSRKKKIKLIESVNPSWRDLYDEIKDDRVEPLSKS
jgi:putative endonuclease